MADARLDAGDPVLQQTGSHVGAFAVTDPASKDAMLLRTLPPASYSVQIGPGAGALGGLMIVEVYEVP